MSAARVLVVEDRDSLRRMLRRALEAEGYVVDEASTGGGGIDKLQTGAFDLVLTDLKLPGASGLEVLAAARQHDGDLPVVVMTAYGTVATAVEAMKAGALDFLEKPVEIEDLYEVVARATSGQMGEPMFELPDGRRIVGAGPQLGAALRLARRVAPTASTVLITGESGTGKELFARAVHALSGRASGPFVAVNCAAIPETLLENELFGHEKGAYTGATRREAGRFEQAAGGTLLLDEIGELGLGVQSKILRVLEERTFERIGGSRTLRADARLIGTTNRDLEAMVADGLFRSDLYYRLNVFPIHLPALRERPDDVPDIARHLLSRLAARSGVDTPRLDDRALSLLCSQPWPGNVRQLANVLERAVILSDNARLTEADMAAVLDPLTGDATATEIRRALDDSGGDRKAAAEALGISYRTLLRRIQKHELQGYPRSER